MKGLFLEDSRGKHFVYIFLTDTKTGFSNISKKLTKDPYNHVSIAFDASLSEIYTFALKTSINGYKGGFKKEDLSIFSKESRFTLYCMEVDSNQLKKMKKRVDEIESNAESSRYNHKSLINTLFNKEVFTSDPDSANFICSEFVDIIFKEADIQIFDKPSSLVKPYDYVRSKKFKFLYRGNICNYSPSKTLLRLNFV